MVSYTLITFVIFHSPHFIIPFLRGGLFVMYLYVVDEYERKLGTGYWSCF